MGKVIKDASGGGWFTEGKEKVVEDQGECGGADVVFGFE